MLSFKNRNRGALDGEFVWFIAFLFILGFLWFYSGGLNRSSDDKSLFQDPPEILDDSQSSQSNNQLDDSEEDSGEENQQEDSNKSIWSGKITLNSGNARYEDDPQDEYIGLYTNLSEDEEVNITGWFLTNNKGNKLIQVSYDSINKGVTDIVYIPRGTNLPRSDRTSFQEDIVLGKSDRVYIVTGKSPDTYPVLLNTSFRTNICTGYFSDTEDFSPYLSGNCPNPDDEVGATSLDDNCSLFVRGISSCTDMSLNSNQTEAFFKLSNQCRSYIQEHFSYRGCLIYHGQDENFGQNEWRIYLERPTKELWSEVNEVITLYDKEGKIIDEIRFGF
jgi:hypothetical protein